MTGQLTALKELAEKVEAGTDTMPDHSACYVRKNGKILADTWTDGKSTAAALGSLDAAHALHKAVLGDRWRTSNAQDFFGNVWSWWLECYDESEMDGSEVEAESTTPARAWLLAIIKAKIAELET